jgi:hypothetical protein
VLSNPAEPKNDSEKNVIKFANPILNLNLRGFDGGSINPMRGCVKTTVRAPVAVFFAYFALRTAVAVDTFRVITR